MSPRPCELFPAGATVRPEARPVSTVTVSPVPGYATRHLVLPIVARRGPVTDWRDLPVLSEQRPLVTMAVLDGATGGPFRLRVRLSRPGRPRLLPMPELLPSGAGSADWPGLIGELPKRLPPALSSAGGLDLVLMVELGGIEEDVAARIRLARGVVEAFRGAPATRIAVLGYRDHFGKHTVDAIAVRAQETDALVVGCGLSTVPGALSMFQRPERWRAVPVHEDNAAPVEDALHLIVDPRWGWRPATRHVLLVLGRRPPHPAKAGRFGEVVLPCPHRYSWPNMLDQLQDEQALECFAVLDHRPATGYAEQAWQQFGAQGRLWRETSTVHDIARAVGLATRSRTSASPRDTRWRGNVSVKGRGDWRMSETPDPGTPDSRKPPPIELPSVIRPEYHRRSWQDSGAYENQDEGDDQEESSSGLDEPDQEPAPLWPDWHRDQADQTIEPSVASVGLYPQVSSVRERDERLREEPHADEAFAPSSTRRTPYPVAEEGTFKIGLWGSPQSGKTTYLAALRHSTGAGDNGCGSWNIYPRNELSRDLLVRFTHTLVHDRRFPEATILGAPVALEWLFVGDIAGIEV